MGLGGGIAVARSATCGYVAGFNINVDGYGEGTPRNDYDIVADPLFLNPAGRDRQLGGDQFADDDFRLQQGRGGQTVESPAVDAGAAPIADIGLTGTTARGDAPDAGVVDIGYHYGAAADQRITVPTPYMPIFVRADGPQLQRWTRAGARTGVDPGRGAARGCGRHGRGRSGNVRGRRYSP